FATYRKCALIAGGFDGEVVSDPPPHPANVAMTIATGNKRKPQYVRFGALLQRLAAAGLHTLAVTRSANWQNLPQTTSTALFMIHPQFGICDLDELSAPSLHLLGWIPGE